MGRKTLVFLLSCLLVAFIGTGTGFTTRAEAFGHAEAEGKTVQTAAAPAEEAQIEPRFGGKSYAAIPFTNSAGLKNGMTLYVKAYAENYIWPFSDIGHAFLLVNYRYEENETSSVEYEDIEISATIQYDWGKDLGGIHSASYTTFTETYYMTDFSSPDDYPYLIEMKSSAKDYNGTGNGNASCYCIWVNVTATTLDGCTATVTNLMATF